MKASGAGTFKKHSKMDISVGYLYDQIGSGIIFRAFEERPLLIDNALFGARLVMRFFRLEDQGIHQCQKQQFDVYSSVIKGLEYRWLSRWRRGRQLVALLLVSAWSTALLDDAAMNSLVATINTYTKEDALCPKYNAYAFSVFNP